MSVIMNYRYDIGNRTEQFKTNFQMQKVKLFDLCTFKTEHIWTLFNFNFCRLVICMYFLKINIEDFCKVCITKERKRLNVIGYKLTSQVLDKTKGRLRSWLVREIFSELHSKMASTETEQQQMYFSEFHHPTMICSCAQTETKFSI